MMKNRLVCFSVSAIIICTLCGSNLLAQEKINKASTPTRVDTVIIKNPTGAMLRSIIVPGWGQFYNRKWFKGVLVAGAETGLVINALVLNQWANESTTEEERLFYIDNRNLSFWILGAVILYSMADAYVDAALFGFDESPELSLDFKTDRDPSVGIAAKTLSLNIAFNL